MLVASNQRWRDHRDSYRPAGEVFDPREYEVAYIPGDNEAKSFVLRHHYSGRYCASRFRFGLYTRSGELAGVAVFGVPSSYASFSVLPCDPKACATLARFVLLDHVKANAESWFLARCFEQLRGRCEGIVSYSDPCRRTNRHGDEVFGGHVGTIYQATNAVYLGTTRASKRWLYPDGTMVEQRAMSKIRKRDKGWESAAAPLRSFGAPPLRAWEDAGRWVKLWVETLCRPIRHAGNHKYVWALRKRDRRHLPDSLPYPKLDVGQLALLGAA